MNWDIKQPKDDDEYFERMSHAIFQSGLNWQMIENKWPESNKAFANWSVDKVAEPFAQVFVSGKSQRTLVSAYRNAMEHMAGSSIKVTWKRTDGKEVDTQVMLVPLTYNGHQFALHFISE